MIIEDVQRWAHIRRTVRRWVPAACWVAATRLSTGIDDLSAGGSCGNCRREAPPRRGMCLESEGHSARLTTERPPSIGSRFAVRHYNRPCIIFVNDATLKNSPGYDSASYTDKIVSFMYCKLDHELPKWETRQLFIRIMNRQELLVPLVNCSKLLECLNLRVVCVQ